MSNLKIFNLDQRVLTFWLLIIGFYLFGSVAVYGQHPVINEVMSSNFSAIQDEDGDYSDWIEIYNPADVPVSLLNYGISDKNEPDRFWIFPDVTLGSGEHLLLFASDKNRTEKPVYWETIIDMADTWKYLVPTSEPSSEWRNITFDDALWLEGKSGFGYGDDDDSTVIQNTLSVFLRKTFDVENIDDVIGMLLHIDYDDAFVAYVNGVEIARGNINSDGPPAYNATANNYDHEAAMYRGGQPEKYEISGYKDILVSGTNVLCVQVHNYNTGSSDLSAIPFLSLGRNSNQNLSKSEFIDIQPVSLHTNFKIAADGETLYLKNDQDLIIDSLFTENLRADISLGRYSDGSENIAYFIETTPGSPNETTAYETISGEVVFSHPGGFYNETFNLTLTSDNPEDLIYYTTDGSEPGSSSDVYTSPISIDETTSIRARAINENSIPGSIVTETYLFTPSHSLPVITVVTDPVNLWDYHNGIYVMGPNAHPDVPHDGANFWQDWEKPIHIAMYEPDGELAFSVNAGVKIFGGYTRSNAQKSLAIHFRKSYGAGSVKYKVFPNLEIEEFSSLVLRNSGNDWNNTMFRDGLLTSLFHEDVDKLAFRPAVVYLNGEYWGIHNIREKANEDFLGSHHQIDPDNITILESNSKPVEGDEEHYLSMLSYLQNNNVAVNTNYEYIKTQMDVFNFIQYQIGQIYIDNTDWPGNNIKYWRENGETGKWRWIVYDTDFGFSIWDQRSYFNTLEFALDANGPDWPNPPWSTFLLRDLIKNSDFKNLFINAYADRLNTVWLPTNVKNQINNFKSKVNNEINRHLTKWNGSNSYWNSNINRMIEFANGRPSAARNHIKTEFGLTGTQNLTLEVNNTQFGSIKLNTIEPESYPWTGIYFMGVPVELKALPKPGHRFVNWEGGSTSARDSISINLIENTTVRAIFEEVSIDIQDVVINEINYRSADEQDAGDWIELHHRGDYSIDISGWVLKDDDDDHEFVFPPNTIIPARGFVVVCRELSKFRSVFPDVSVAMGDMDFGLSSSADCVRLYSADLQKTDEVCYTSASPWPEEANGNGSTLALIHPSYDNSNVENWYALGQNGNPGQKNAIVTNINNEQNTNSFSVYPNPFRNYLSISIEKDHHAEVSIKLFDLSGKVVAKIWEGTLNQFRTIYWQPDKPLKPGIYFVSTITGNNTETLKVVVQ